LGVKLVELWNVLLDQLVLEWEVQSDCRTSSEGWEAWCFGAWQIWEIKVNLGLRELNEGVEGADEVPTTIIDIVALYVLRELVVFDAVCDGLYSACREYYHDESNHKDQKGSAATASKLRVIAEYFHNIIIK
jgi:hypothetical protein